MLISMSVLSVLSLGHFISSSFTTEEEEMIWKLEKKIVDKRLVNSVKYHILPQDYCEACLHVKSLKTNVKTNTRYK